jgi:hypothetical protein
MATAPHMIVHHSNRTGQRGPLRSSRDLDHIAIDLLPVRNFIPPDGEEFRWATAVTLPAIGATATVVSFVVPKGRNAVINFLANEFVGGGFQSGTGNIVWQLYRDATGFAQGKGKVMPNFDNITMSLGAVNNPPRLNGLLASEQQLVALIIKNVSVVTSGQQILGLLGGYYIPNDLVPATFAF